MWSDCALTNLLIIEVPGRFIKLKVAQFPTTFFYKWNSLYLPFSLRQSQLFTSETYLTFKVPYLAWIKPQGSWPKEQCYVENNLCCPKIFIGMTHLFAKIEMTKVNNSTLLRVTIPCIRGSLMDLQNFFKLSLAKNFELSGGYFASS